MTTAFGKRGGTKKTETSSPVALCVVFAEGIPVRDTASYFHDAQDTGTTPRRLENCPGVVSPGETSASIVPRTITRPGRIGLVSKSGTLTCTMMSELRNIGFRTAVGIGGDPVIGTTYIDCLAAFEADPHTDGIVMIGEIGGDAAERAVDYDSANVTKPVVSYVTGFTARGQDHAPCRRHHFRLLRYGRRRA